MTDKPTQESRVLNRLQQGPLCATEMLSAYIPRGAAVIWVLKHKRGYNIETVKWCRNPHHGHETLQVLYVLHTEPTQTEMEMKW